MQAVELGPVQDSHRTQSAFDLFLIFAGPNIVATTFQVGASLSGTFSAGQALTIIAVGAVLGSALVASLAPLGPRLGVPSVIAARAALGLKGAGLVAGLLYVTNFAWIALNNVIAASVCTRLLGGRGLEPVWAVALGLTATAVVARGPRAVGWADRVAVPLMLTVGGVLTFAVLHLPSPWLSATGPSSGRWLDGLDVVIGYQVSWILMFADYSRYTRSASRATGAVFLGLALTSLWFMPLGLAAAGAAGSSDPGAMLAATGVGWWGALLLALATLTTNFVNIYLSSLAWKSLVPGTSDRVAVWSIGGIGSALSLFSTAWLDNFAAYMLVLGGVLVPVGGVLLAHYFVFREPTSVPDLYDVHGPYSRFGGWVVAGLGAWAGGALVYFVGTPLGSTVPALATSTAAYGLLRVLIPGARPAGGGRAGYSTG